MAYRLLADGTVLLHVAFVLFVLLGGLLVLRRPRLAWLHLPAAAWGAWVEFAGWLCPLTPLENWLRWQAGEPAYTTGFVEHYLLPLLYPDSLTRELQLGLGVLVLLVNAVIYASLPWRRVAGAQGAGALVTARGSAQISSGAGKASDAWEVWRQDDHGNRFRVERGLREEDARALLVRLEAGAHKQTYWVRRASPERSDGDADSGCWFRP